MSANGLVAIGCNDKCVVILDSNSNYSVKETIKNLAGEVREVHFCPLTEHFFRRRLALPFLQTDLFLPSDASVEPIMFMALINQIVNMNDSLNRNNIQIGCELPLSVFLASLFSRIQLDLVTFLQSF